MTDRILTPVIALGLALLVWMYTRSRDQEQIDNWPVPVELEVNPEQAANYENGTRGPHEVKVSFIGPPSRIRELRKVLHRGEVRLTKTITVPPDRESEPRFDQTLRIEPAQVPVPPGVMAVILENQNSIPVTLWRVVEKQLPVRLNKQDLGDRVDQEILEPSTVTVRGRQDDLSRTVDISTQPVTIEGKQTNQPVTVEEHVAVSPELFNRPVRVTPSVISVRFVLKPRQTLKELTEVPVNFLCPPNFPFRPEFVNERAGKIALRVLGPATEDRPAVTVYVDLTVRKFGAGLHAEEPLKIQLPPGFTLVGVPPRLSSFRLVPIDGPMKSNDAVIPGT